MNKAAWVALLLAAIPAGTRADIGEPGVSNEDLVASEKPEYRKCLGDMAGHEKPEAAIPVCHAGNGTYAQYKAVLMVLRGTDWFPFAKFSTLVGEVRVVCRADGPPLPSRIVYPARGERGRARVELSCAQTPRQAKKTLEGAVLALGLAMTDKARLPKLAREVVSGAGQAQVNGRPYSFKLAGFVVCAGVEPEREKVDDELLSADPATRVRALIRARDRIDDREWFERMSATLEKLGKDRLAELVEEGFDSPDARVRLWALDQVATVPEERRNAIVVRALGDSSPDVRSRAIPYVAKLGEPFVSRALHDSDAVVRMLAFDMIIPSLFDQHQEARARRFLEEAATDQDSGIRETAEGRLRLMREQEEYIRAGRPGWEDGELLREPASK